MKQPYPPEYDMDFDEDDAAENSFEVQGIDDCDYLFHGSFTLDDDTDETYTVYIRVSQNPVDKKYYASDTVDGGHFVESFLENDGPYDSPEDALRGCSGCFDCLYENAEGREIEFCAETLRILFGKA